MLENRLRAAVKEGEISPVGVPPATLDGLHASETALRKALERTWRWHPLYDWATEIKGLKSGTLVARLLAELGDPLIAQPMSGGRDENGEWHVVPAGPPFERTLRQLWQFCGVGDPNRKHRRGGTEDENRAAGRPMARMRLWLICDQMVRQRTPRYREVYDEEKARALALELTAGHADNRARRKMGKEFLRDLWQEARRLQSVGDYVRE